MPNAARALRHFLADASEPGDAERLAAQLGAEKALLFPAPVLHRVIGGRHRARQRQHQRAGVLGDADAVRARRVDDEDAARAGGGDVDVVDAGAGAGDDAEPRRRVHQRRVHFGRAADEQGVGVGEVGGERVRLASGARIDDPAAFGAEQIQRGGREIVGDDDFQWDSWPAPSDADVVDDVPDLMLGQLAA